MASKTPSPPTSSPVASGPPPSTPPLGLNNPALAAQIAALAGGNATVLGGSTAGQAPSWQQSTASTPRPGAPPKYVDGDQLYPQSQNLSPQAIMQLQLQLKTAGLLNKKYVPGVWDQVSADAMEQLMTYANRSGVDKEAMLKTWTQAASSEDQKTGATLVVQSPEDIKAVLKSTSAKILGRGLSEDELTRLTAGYQNIDRTAQEQKNASDMAAQLDGTTTSVVATPSIDNYAASQLQQQHPDEAKWYEATQRMKEFYSILGEGGAGGSNG